MTDQSVTSGTATGIESDRPLLSVRDLRVGFRRRDGVSVPAVKGLTVDLPAGGSLAVVGESGSGKTVSMRALLRLLPATAQVSGEAYFEGRDLLALPEDQLRAVRGRGIGMVFQNAMEALNPTRTLKVQMTEHLRWHRVCGRAEAARRAIAALDRVGIPEPERRIKMYPFQLSGGMRQRAMIAMAIVAGPRLLIADEPTTAVDVTIQRQVLDLLKDLSDDGLSIIMITHDLGVARYLFDDVVVMRDGQAVETAPMARFATAAAHPYSRQLVAAALDIDITHHSPNEFQKAAVDRDEAPLVKATDVVKVFHGRGGAVRAVDEVSVSIAAGETVGVVGESGSGKSTLARLLMRLVEPTSGRIAFGDADMLTANRRALQDLRRRTQMVFQNPYGSLLPHLSIAANVIEPLRVHKVGSSRERRARAVELLEMVGIPRERVDHYPRQFSGGQQQRVAIARALALEPELLICDEPTSALDVSIQAQILDLLTGLQQRLGLSMLFVTHNLAVAQRLCHRIIVMAGGHIVEAAPTAELFAHPRHPYTQALLAAVLPVHGEPRDSRPATAVDVAVGELLEVSLKHWVRTPHAASSPQHHITEPVVRRAPREQL